MIQANELRIGNWVYRQFSNPAPNNERYLTEMCIVSSIKTISVNLLLKDNSIVGKYPVASLLPIPLSTDILVKCGFEKKIGTLANPNAIYFDICNNEYRIYIDELYCSIHINALDWLPKLSNLESLHQLQNLYFALFKTELNINL